MSLSIDFLYVRDSVLHPGGFRKATPADLIEIAKTLPGAMVGDTEILNVEGAPLRVLVVPSASGRYLVIPLTEENLVQQAHNSRATDEYKTEEP